MNRKIKSILDQLLNETTERELKFDIVGSERRQIVQTKAKLDYNVYFTDTYYDYKTELAKKQKYFRTREIKKIEAYFVTGTEPIAREWNNSEIDDYSENTTFTLKETVDATDNFFISREYNTMQNIQTMLCSVLSHKRAKKPLDTYKTVAIITTKRSVYLFLRLHQRQLHTKPIARHRPGQF